MTRPETINAPRLAHGQPGETTVMVIDGQRAFGGRRGGYRTTVRHIPLESLQAGDLVISYTGKALRLRMAGSRVEANTCQPFNGALITARSEGGLASSYTPEHLCIAKTGGAFRGRTLLYLMQRGSSYRVGVTSAYHSRGGQRGYSSGLAARLLEEYGDAIWVLDVFDDKRDALVAEAMTVVLYGVPEMRFISHGQPSAIGQERLDGFWNALGDLTGKAAACLAAHGRDIRYPIAARTHNEVGVRIGYSLYTRATKVRACNLITGMDLLDARPLCDRRDQRASRFDSAWAPITITREPYQGAIWSLTVETDHTY
ncbi:MAG: hypothetical protein KGJ86_14205, partial [Chloroflexota bacterium]|nr:hypothetical protein [Chloroflexota bacterium]